MRLSGKPFEDLTLEWAVKLGAIIGSMAGAGSLVVSGRDNTPISRMYKRAITAGIMSAGAEVMDFHESLVGEISFAMKRFGGKYGFMVMNDPLVRGNLLIKVFKAPGYELVGSELKDLLGEVKAIPRPTRIGWVNYAEYMHKLYGAAIISFVKADAVAGANISTVVGPGSEPLSTVLGVISSELSVNQITIGVAKTQQTYPEMELMKNVEAIRGVLNTNFGVAFSIDGASLIVATKKGFMLPGELARALARKYASGARILAKSPLQEGIVKALVSEGFDVVVVDSVDEYSKLLRRERPDIAFTPSGEFTTPLFSLGADALVVYAQLLESLAEQGEGVFEESLVDSLRSAAETVDEASALRACREKGLLTLWGCVISEGDRVIALIYEPRARAFLKIADRAASPTT
ncbi:MAG: hypothetical protein ACP5KA_00575 [Desulfurococcaceae archaeon]|jgi:phosphomannomutase